MSITHFCFIVGVLAAMLGMSLGIVMGIAHDFTLAPAHAHLNVLGWVTMALYGLYYRDRVPAAGRLQWVQVGAAALGAPLITGGLALTLTEAVPVLTGMAELAVIVGSLLTIAAMVLFSTVVFGDALRVAKRRRGLGLDGDFDPRSG
jgi:hypothetical protein